MEGCILESCINYWSDYQIDTLKEIYPYHSNDELAIILSHPKNSVSNKAIELGLKKQKWWTEDEIEIIKKHYAKLGATEIREMYLPHRTVASIKKKAHQLQISLDNDVAFEIRNNNLKGRLTASIEEHPDFKNCKDLRNMARNRIGKWRKEVLEHYNFKCALTGSKDNIVVHHIYPFSKIFYNTLKYYENTYGFIKDDDIQKCININGINLVENFLNQIYINHKIEHGIVISKKIHDLFHSIYGTYYFSRDDFYEFIKKYNNGSYKGVVTL